MDAFAQSQASASTCGPAFVATEARSLAVVSALCPALHFRALLADVLDDGHPIPMLQRYP